VTKKGVQAELDTPFLWTAVLGVKNMFFDSSFILLL
jgi:hypothetical protein